MVENCRLISRLAPGDARGSRDFPHPDLSRDLPQDLSRLRTDVFSESNLGRRGTEKSSFRAACVPSTGMRSA